VGTPTSVPTETSASNRSPAVSAPAPEQSRFLPGTVLGKRYRIVGLIGKGGMGEVYRADDLKLGQPVALKFLPPAVERDESRLQRFLNEVRVALKVTHPNACRVFDVGEFEGQHYLSMEYVDGEDLSSLLRRIGRLPQDKAVQIARQLCAGLAAAHEQGILHRDLKPANVMIDGRGRAKITDFGLAGLAEGIVGDEVRSGTPGYMAPEQLTGKGVSIRSDIYSLGLVLYELFTGKRAYDARTATDVARLQEESLPTSPTSHVEGLDPAVERAILQCLEREPEDRPHSALAVAASLPGGDPLAAALAAGETPSPEMVAAAGPQGGLKPWLASLCLALVIAELLFNMATVGKFFILHHVPMNKSFDALKDDAREIASDLGYTDPPKDSYASFELGMPEYWDVLERHEPGEGWDAFQQAGLAVVWLSYRQSAGNLVPDDLGGAVSRNNPPFRAGDLWMALDLDGRLRRLEVKPPQAEWSSDPPPLFEWRVLFEAAGLEIETFEPTAPTRQPDVFVDTRSAWTGIQRERGDGPVRVEAGTCHGKPVYFEMILPTDSYWAEEEAENPFELPVIMQALSVTLLVIVLLVAAGIVLLAVRNLKLGRGDRKGALRVAWLIVALRLMHWVLAGHHVASIEEIYLAVIALSGALSIGLVVWVLYIALEPYVRRLWPRAIVSWSRLLAGRFRDPLVGRDLLLGFAIYAVSSFVLAPLFWAAVAFDWLPPFPVMDQLDAIRGGRFAVGEVFSLGLMVLTAGLALMTTFLLFRVVVRKTWIAAILYGTVYALWNTMGFVFMTQNRMIETVLALGVATAVIQTAFLLFLLIRFGLLTTLAYFLSAMMSSRFPVTLDVSAPYFTASLIGPLVLVAIVFYSFRVSLAGRPLFSESPTEAP
jgi:serine/threonine-protein kinase